MGPLTPEAELLLLVARPTLDEPHHQRISTLIQSGLDWDLLHILASRHRLGPFLYVHVNAAAATEVPRPVFMELWRSHERNARRNRALAAEFSRVVRLLEDGGVPALPFKGPVLAEQLYGDAALREFEDLDVLVRIADLPRVRALLAADRYEVEDTLDGAAEQAMYRARAQYHRVFVHRDTGDKLEVHWKTDSLFPVEQSHDDGWWSSPARVAFGTESVRAFSPSELLMILCLHSSKHQGHRLGWLVDIAQLIRREPIDWRWLASTAAKLRCRRRVFVSLLLARDWVDAPVPGDLIRALPDEPAIREAAAIASSRFFTRDIWELQSVERLRLDLKMCDTTWQRVRYAIEVTFAPTKLEWSAYGLPRPFEFLYLPLRLMRLATKYGRR
jgi:hypothetical protein